MAYRPRWAGPTTVAAEKGIGGRDCGRAVGVLRVIGRYLLSSKLTLGLIMTYKVA